MDDAEVALFHPERLCRSSIQRPCSFKFEYLKMCYNQLTNHRSLDKNKMGGLVWRVSFR